MDIAAEKALIVKRFNEVDDESLIQAIKRLLDLSANNQVTDEYDAAMEASIQRGLRQSGEGQVRRHEDVWKEIRSRYNA